MSQRFTDWRTWTEVFTAVAAGIVFILVCPLDPDEVLELYWSVVLLVVGFTFGVFGRCPVLLIGPAFALAMFYFSFRGPFSEFWDLELCFYAFLCLEVLVGAAVGRGVKRLWKKRKAKYVAQPCAAPNGGAATPAGNSGVSERRHR
jgi:hypothetical protein